MITYLTLNVVYIQMTVPIPNILTNLLQARRGIYFILQQFVSIFHNIMCA